jgi:glycosyltransferase involved in cell wall biosynthesis
MVLPSLSLVLPMFNESESVDSTLARALRSLGENFADFEIIVVDDGSTDNCVSKVERWARQDQRIVLVLLPHNQRFGGALRRGLETASKETVLYTDFDLPVSPDFFPTVLQALKRADVVTGFSAAQRKNLSWYSKLISRTYNLLVHTFCRLPVRDVNFGLKAMRGSLCQQLRLASSSPFIDAEILLRAKRMGCRIAELAVPFSPRKYGVSQIRRLDVVAWTLADMAAWCLAARLSYPIKWSCERNFPATSSPLL